MWALAYDHWKKIQDPSGAVIHSGVTHTTPSKLFLLKKYLGGQYLGHTHRGRVLLEYILCHIDDFSEKLNDGV